MISGPIVPTNGEGLLALLQSDPTRLETGLRLVATGLALDGGLVVDALGRDALGQPVVVVLASPDAQRSGEPDRIGEPGSADLLVRVVTLHRWFVEHARFLSGLIPGVAFPTDAHVRMMVVGAALDPGLVAGVRGLSLPDVQLLRMRVFRVAGREWFGVEDLTGADAAHDGFELPAAVVGDRARSVGGRFLELLRKLDGSLEVRGDRYGRRFYCRGCFLVELRMQESGALMVRLHDDVARPLATGADVAAWFDRVARSYLDVVRDRVDVGAGPGVEDAAGAVAAGGEVAAGRTEHGASATRPAGIRASAQAPVFRAGEVSPVRSPGLGERRGTAYDVALSEDEFNALQQPGGLPGAGSGAGPDGGPDGRSRGGRR